MTDFKLQWPVQGYQRINQGFGEHPENYREWGLPGHEGIDFLAPSGTPVLACAPGEVYQVRSDKDGNAYGNHVRIKHADGYQTIYAHLSVTQVNVGDHVETGQQIGLSGNTGNSRGAHLHLTLKHEGATASHETRYPLDIIDPTPFLVFPVVSPEGALTPSARNGLFLRSGPGREFPSLLLLKVGDLLVPIQSAAAVDHLLLQPDAWIQVRFGGQQGWCLSRYLKRAG
jgi:murein DD-endopeptidase MepM/ murein hydrolase activator NlpD